MLRGNLRIKMAEKQLRHMHVLCMYGQILRRSAGKLVPFCIVFAIRAIVQIWAHYTRVSILHEFCIEFAKYLEIAQIVGQTSVPLYIGLSKYRISILGSFLLFAETPLMRRQKYGCASAHLRTVPLGPFRGHVSLLPWRFLPGPVAMDMDYPRPAPTTIHYRSRCAPLFLYIYSWALPPVWSGRYLIHIPIGRSAAQFAAAPCNSFCVHVQSLNIRSLFFIIV